MGLKLKLIQSCSTAIADYREALHPRCHNEHCRKSFPLREHCFSEHVCCQPRDDRGGGCRRCGCPPRGQGECGRFNRHLESESLRESREDRLRVEAPQWKE